MLYEQKVKYMEYRESGRKVKGAGFVKMECWGDACNFLVQISGLSPDCGGEKKVYLLGGRREILLGEICLDGGRGRLELQGENSLRPEKTGLDVREAEMVRIPIAPEKEIVGFLKEPTEVKAQREVQPAKPKAQPEAEAPAQESAKAQATQPRAQSAQPGAQLVQSGVQSEIEAPAQESAKAQATQSGAKEQRKNEATLEESAKTQSSQSQAQFQAGVSAQESAKTQPMQPPGAQPEVEATAQESVKAQPTQPGMRRGKNLQAKEQQEARSMQPAQQGAESTLQGSAEKPLDAQPYVFQTALQPNKWEQLHSIYPAIRPFGDEREYLRISPGDFVILKDKSYRLANNSFLLHGYFNYKHLILHRAAKKGEESYFVGVPGNFYDKEKEVAILFGFESFECAREPAREGDYGYYMMRVEL